MSRYSLHVDVCVGYERSKFSFHAHPSPCGRAARAALDRRTDALPRWLVRTARRATAHMVRQPVRATRAALPIMLHAIYFQLPPSTPRHPRILHGAARGRERAQPGGRPACHRGPRPPARTHTPRMPRTPPLQTHTRTCWLHTIPGSLAHARHTAARACAPRPPRAPSRRARAPTPPRPARPRRPTLETRPPLARCQRPARGGV